MNTLTIWARRAGWKAALLAGCQLMAATMPVDAADPMAATWGAVPEPPEAATDSAAPSDARGIWGAIAFSAADSKHGIFWGADTRNEAERTALKYCGNVGGSECAVVETYRNHRHWDDDDGTYPYKSCVALAVSDRGLWGSASAVTLGEARDAALTECGGKSCKIVDTGCT